MSADHTQQPHDNITEHQPRKSSVLGSYPADFERKPAPESLSHGKLDNIIGTIHKDQESPYRKGSAEHTAKEQYYGGHPPEHEFRESEMKKSHGHQHGHQHDQQHDHQQDQQHGHEHGQHDQQHGHGHKFGDIFHHGSKEQCKECAENLPATAHQ